MTHDFQIAFERPQADPGSDIRRLCVRLAGSSLTRLMRRGSNRPDDWLEAPPLPLAFWFLDNWWRIRWEPAPPSRVFPAQWRLAHHLPSVGAGYPWPNVSVWGEGHRCGIAVHADVNNLQPSLRFLAERALEYVPASVAEDAIDGFVGAVIDDIGSNCDGLDVEYKQLNAERNDPVATAWRKLEAMLGFDPDDAPRPLVAAYEAMAERYGRDGVQEAALAHQGSSTEALQHAVDAANASRLVLRPPEAISAIQVDKTTLAPPWQLAVDAARRLRERLRVPPGPIRNPRLGEVLNVNVDQLKTGSRPSLDIPYALRLRAPSGRHSKLALRSRWSHQRRFEVCRSLGDIVWSRDDPMGPVSRAKSERQKFQRAFAQEFLCPYDDLRGYIPADRPANDDIHAAARHFHVSERLIQTTLVNHHDIDQESFAQMVDAA